MWLSGSDGEVMQFVFGFQNLINPVKVVSSSSVTLTEKVVRDNAAFHKRKRS